MIPIQIDKFNVINKLINKNIDYISIVKNFLENYLESIITYQPDYIYQLIWNNIISHEEVNKLFDEILLNFLFEKRKKFRNLIKTEMFNFNILIKEIQNFENNIFKLNYLLLKKNINKLSSNMKLENNNFNISDNTRFILSDPLLINYLENEFIKLDIDTIKNINILIHCLSNNDIYNENITWFMNLIGNSLKNNITSISANIPDKYKYLYEFNNTVEYIYKINKIFNFINKFDKYSLLEPIYVIILDKLIICIENCDFIELLTFIDKYSLLVNKIFEDMNSERIFRLRHINKNLIINKKSENYLGIYNKKIIIDAISNNINKQLVNINIFSYDKIILLLELVIKCNLITNLIKNGRTHLRILPFM
jgi:hypothetical protein